MPARLFKKTCLCTVLPSLFLIFQIPPLWGENQNSHTLFKKEDGKRGGVRTIFLWRLSIQKHPKSPITEKRRNKAKYLTWNSIRLKFVKKTSMPNPAKSLGYIKCHSSSSPDLLIALAILSDTTVRRSEVDREDVKPYWKSESFYLQVFQRLY